MAALVPLPTRPLVELAEALLHHPSPDAQQIEDLSDLNINGSPIQILLSARKSRWAFRIIGDPAFYCPDPLARWRASERALDELSALLGTEAMLYPLQRFLAKTVPQDPRMLRSYPSGMIRLAAAPETAGIALYAAPPPGPDPLRWAAASSWAEDLFPKPLFAQRLINTLQSHCILFGMGMEGVNPAQMRAKLYWRLKDAAPLASFGIPWFEDDSIRRFLSIVVPSGSVPANALTFSAGFDAGSGELADIKVDVCTSTGYSDVAGALSSINELAEKLDLHPPALTGSHELFARHALDIGCIGLGLGREKSHRLNVYVYQSKPTTQ